MLRDKESTISNPEEYDCDVAKYDEAVTEKLPPVKGTLKVHQITTQVPGKIYHREVSCFWSRTNISCLWKLTSVGDSHKEVEIRPQAEAVSSPGQAAAEYLNGRFVIVEYNDQPFVGQVLQTLEDVVQVSCMMQNGILMKFTTSSLMSKSSSQNLCHVQQEPQG